MIGFTFKTIDQFDRVLNAAEKAGFKNLGHAAASTRKTAIASIKEAPGASPPGTPPHTHTQKVTRRGKTRLGHLPRAIAFHHDRKEMRAVVGPRESVVGTAGAAHEHGGDYKGEEYPKRPTIVPALTQNLDRFASDWAGSIGE